MFEAYRAASRRIESYYPILPVAAGLILGVLSDDAFRFNRWFYAVLTLPCILIAVFRPLRRGCGLPAALVVSACAGGMLHLSVARPPSSDEVERYATDVGRIARLRGIVASEARILKDDKNEFRRWMRRSPRTVFLVDIDSIEGVDGGDVSTRGRIRVSVKEPVLNLQPLDRVELFGRLRSLRPPGNPGAFDWATFWRRQGITAQLICERRENVRSLPRAIHESIGISDRTDSSRLVAAAGAENKRVNFGSSPSMDITTRAKSAIDWLRRTASAMLVSDLAVGTDEEESLLQAMVLGSRSQFDRRLNEVFIRAGVIHFIAVSGTNVAILMSVIWFAGRMLRFSKRRCAMAMMIVVLLYALIAEPRPPILRAAIMGLLFCISLMLRRPTSRLNWLSASAVLLVLVDPRTVFDAGFQLSFAAVVGVGYLAPAMYVAAVPRRRWGVAVDDSTKEAFRPVRRYVGAAWRWIMMVIFAALAAWFMGLPVIATVFHRIQPWGAFASIFMYPLMSLVMVLGVLKIAATAISPMVGTWIAFPLDRLDNVAIAWAEWLAQLPGSSWNCREPAPWMTICYYAILILFINVMVRARPESGDSNSSEETSGLGTASKRIAKARWLLLPVVALALLLLNVHQRNGAEAGNLIVTVLSVGHGSAAVIALPDGRVVLYDAGSSYNSDPGRTAVVPYLRSRGVNGIDRIFISHPNLDHFNGVPGILSEIATGPVMVNQFFESVSAPRSPARHLLSLLKERRHPVRELESEMEWFMGDVLFERLWPPDQLPENVIVNDTSTVLRLTYRGRSLLITGDIEEYAQQELLRGTDIHADVHLLPHHGSFRQSTPEFIRRVGASVAVRSAGTRGEEIDSRLLEAVGQSLLLNTADVGAVEIRIDSGGQLQWRTMFWQKSEEERGRPVATFSQ